MRCLTTLAAGGGYRLRPDLSFGVFSVCQLFLRRRDIGQILVGREPRIQIAPEAIPDAGLGVGGYHIDPLPGGADRVDLIGDQMPPGVEPLGSAGEGKREEQPPAGQTMNRMMVNANA